MRSPARETAQGRAPSFHSEGVGVHCERKLNPHRFASHFRDMSQRSLFWGAVLGLSWTLGACSGHLGAPGDDASGDGLVGAGASNGIEGGEGSEDLELASGLELEGDPKYFRVVRLTHGEWEASVRDVLLLPAVTGLSTGFIPDPPEGHFDNNEKALYVTDTLWLDYQRTAESVAESVAGDAAALARLGSAGDAAGFINTVGRRAFRRALTPEETAAYQALWNSGATYFASGDAFKDGAQVFIEALLQSPHFLYRIQLSEAGTRLVGGELATRVSYFLRGTTPSDALLDAASAGQLDTPEGLLAVVTAMLDEDGARLALERFHGQLFGLERYDSILKDATNFPEYSEALNQTFREADLLYFSRLYTGGFGLRELLLSNVAFVNDATAFVYGVPSPGAALAPVTLDGSRPGFLTRAGFLAYNGTLNDPDPIHRGVDINRKLLCTNISPPPGEIPPLPPYEPGQTNRERVVAHTEAPSADGSPSQCAGCHGPLINPPGFALENFDAIGRARTTDNGKPVDTTGSFGQLDGQQTFSGIVELAGLLAESRKVHSCYAAHISEFAFARDLGTNDVPLLDAMELQSREQNYSVRDLVLAVVGSERFALSISGSP